MDNMPIQHDASRKGKAAMIGLISVLIIVTGIVLYSLFK
jgi:hypothetical protein